MKSPMMVREPTKEEKQVAQGHFSKGSSLHSKDELEKAVHHYREAAKFDETVVMSDTRSRVAA